MKRQFQSAAIVAAAAALAACSHMTPHYGLSAANIETIHQVGGATPAKVSVGAFSAAQPGQHAITCRAAGGVGTPDGEPFATYVQNALVSELKVANVYAADSKIRIDGKLDNIDFNSNIGAGKWLVDLTVSGPGIETFAIHESYPFSTNWVADKACEQVAAALQPAVQETLGKLYASSGFKTLVAGAAK
jgi:hypothetical protein